MDILWGGTRTLLHSLTIVSWLLLLCFCISCLSHCNSLNLPFGIQGRSRSLNGAYFLQTRNGRQKESVLRRDPLGLAQFHLGILMESILFHCFLYLCDSVSLLSGVFSVFFFFKRRSCELCLGFPDSSVVKNLPAMLETQVQSLGRKDPLEKEMATHSSIFAWEISW